MEPLIKILLAPNIICQNVAIDLSQMFEKCCFQKNIYINKMLVPNPAHAFQRTPLRRVLMRMPTTRSWARGQRWTPRHWAARTGGWWSSSVCAQRKSPRIDPRRVRSFRLWRATPSQIKHLVTWSLLTNWLSPLLLLDIQVMNVVRCLGSRPCHDGLRGLY